MLADPIPKGAQIVTPYLLLPDAGRAMKFLTAAFGARETLRQTRPDGTVMHVELEIGGSQLMMGEPMGDMEPMPAQFFLRVEDCDAVYDRALDLGGDSVMKPTHMRHAGERYGGVRDPAGNIWWIATHVEDLTEEEAQRRIDEWAREDDSPWS